MLRSDGLRSAAAGDESGTRKLIGHDIKNAEGETIGGIKSIYVNKDGLNKDGRVDSVMVSLGGFLGVGEREVHIT